MSDGASTATILFSDVVASTELRTTLGEERADALRREHDALLQRCINEHHGRVVKGTGDGVMAVFTSASDALSAAVGMQRAVDAHNRRSTAHAIRIRVGLSVGDVSWENDDCFGTPVIEASRIQAEAAPGQILCSDFVRMMARGRGGHTFGEKGPVALKGLPEPLVLFEVTWETAAPEAQSVPFPPELAVDHDTPFVSRRDEIAAISAFLGQRQGGRAGSVWVMGEPGIGKSRLAAEAAWAAHERGAIVLFGRCDEDHGIPLQPFIEALQSYVRALPDDLIESSMGPDPAALARLVPAIRSRAGSLGPPDGEEADNAYRLYEAVRGWLEHASRANDLVLVLDDVHWATRETLHLVRHCAGSSVEARVVLICTSRNTEADRGTVMLEIIDDLRRRGAPHLVLELGGLSRADVASLVAQTVGRDLDEELRSRSELVHGESAGNPLFVTALARTLGRADGDPGSPGNVLAAVRRRVRSLPEPVLDLLRVAAVIGSEFDLRVLSHVLEKGEMETLSALEAAVATRVVGESGANEFRWTHDLVRTALRGDLSDARRVRLHARVVAAIESVFRPAGAEQLSALAYHSWEGRSVLRAPAVFNYQARAGEAASALFSYEDAANLLGRALELTPAIPDLEVCSLFEVKVGLGEALAKGGDLARAMELLEEAVGDCVAAGEGTLAARAAIAYEECGFQEGYGETAMELLESAKRLADPADPRQRVRLQAAYGRALSLAGRIEDAIREGREAVALARSLDDDRLIVLALVSYANGQFSWSWQANYAEGLSIAAEVTQRASPADGVNYIMALNFLTWMSYQAGDWQELQIAAGHLGRFALETRQPFYEHIAGGWPAFLAYLEGDLPRAERLIIEKFQSAQRVRGLDISGVEGIEMFMLRREQGRLREIEPAFRLIMRLAPPGGVWRVGLAALLAELGDIKGARELVDELCADDLVGLSRDGTWMNNLLLLADACTITGSAGAAATLYANVRGHDGHMLAMSTVEYPAGPAARYLGKLAGVAERWDDAKRHFRDALEMEAKFNSPFTLAHTLYEYGRMLHRRGDRAAAAPLLERAGAICSERGLVGLGDKIAVLRES